MSKKTRRYRELLVGMSIARELPVALCPDFMTALHAMYMSNDEIPALKDGTLTDSWVDLEKKYRWKDQE